MSRKQNKKKLLPTVMSSLILWVMSIVLSTMMATIGVPIIANAEDL